jgi:DNA replication protein DnaC
MPCPTDSLASDARLRKRWTEQAGNTLFEFEGDPASAATRGVVAIHSLASLAERQKAAGIPVPLRGALLANWDDSKANPGALNLVRSYLVAPSVSLYIFGSVGVGKTHCAATIANELLEASNSVSFQTVSSLLLELRDTFRPESLRSELDLLSPLFEVSYLVLDELGDLSLERERRASEFAVSRILTVLDRRWQEGRPTIMTSNLSLAQLVKWTGGDERIGSRIRGMCGEENIVELSGRDLRFDSENEPALFSVTNQAQQ